MKKVFCLLLVLYMVISAVPTFAADTEEKTIPDTWQIVYDSWNNTTLFWAEINGDICTIKAVAQYSGDELVVPYKDDLHVKVDPVHSTIGDLLNISTLLIDKDAFKKGADAVKTITFADGYEILPEGLCEGMYNLTTVNLPKSLYAIGNRCFKDCTSLEKVTGLHKGISLGQDAFAGTKVDLNNISEDAVSDTEKDEESYIYPAKDVFKNQSDIVELTADALSWFPKDNDPESEKYDFTTTDKEIIEAVMKAVNACRYKEVKGTLASDGTAFLITVKYSDGTEAYYNFKQSTVYINKTKYQLLNDDYWNLSECLKYSKQSILKKERLFSDVATDSEYYEAIKALSTLGVMEGYDDRTFKSEETLTRAEAAAIIIRLVKLDDEAEQDETNFKDVSENHWASGYVNLAEANKIINGQGDGTFAPDEYVTKHQMIKMLVCTLGYEPVALANGGWNNNGYITAAEEMGLIEKEPENKNEPITRGEAALLCYKAMDIDFMDETWYNCTGMGASAYEISVGETILTEYWGMDYEVVREFYFEKTFGFELPKGAKSVEGEYWVEDNPDELCYMGKISFNEKDLEYIKENLEKQDFEDGTVVEDSDVLHGGRHDRDAHLSWWDAGTYGTQKEHYHWIKEDATVRVTRAVEFEAFIIKDNDGTYWLYVYKNDTEEVN